MTRVFFLSWPRLSCSTMRTSTLFRRLQGVYVFVCLLLFCVADRSRCCASCHAQGGSIDLCSATDSLDDDFDAAKHRLSPSEAMRVASLQVRASERTRVRARAEPRSRRPPSRAMPTSAAPTRRMTTRIIWCAPRRRRRRAAADERNAKKHTPHTKHNRRRVKSTRPTNRCPSLRAIRRWPN